MPDARSGAQRRDPEGVAAPASSRCPVMSLPDQHDSPNLEDLTPEEANRIIHSHRKVRYGQSTPVVASECSAILASSRVVLA